ncbi:ABC transporter substrate-binding protein [Niabella terrae]
MVLKGITWNHSRGITPLLAAAQRFNELHPDIELVWEKRSLQQFADQPLEALAPEYDLLIIDHPWVGCAAATGAVLPLDQHLPASLLKELSAHGVGVSHESYAYEGHQWALAIDGAAPAASFRPDLLTKHGLSVPRNWQDLLELAARGKVALPAIPIDTLMNFYSFCIACGRPPFTDSSAVIDTATGVAALETMRALYRHLDARFFDANPIAVAELMSATDDYWYCPFAYNYSNYARAGYGSHRLQYGSLIEVNGRQLSTTLGGTGIAVSASSQYPAEALAFLQCVCSPEWQATEYIYHGGQPGYDYGWKHSGINAMSGNFFVDTLPVIENAYLRPRYNGYLHFQDHAGDPIREYLQYGKTDPGVVLGRLNEIYQKTLNANLI